MRLSLPRKAPGRSPVDHQGFFRNRRCIVRPNQALTGQVRPLMAVTPGVQSALCRKGRKEGQMYLARFYYDVLPVNRQRAIEFIRREVEAARKNGLDARMLVPLTRGHGDHTALQFEVELKGLDQLEGFRNRGVGSSEETGNWMHAFSEILTRPPCVEILRIEP
jgi:hypothetical protein